MPIAFAPPPPAIAPAPQQPPPLSFIGLRAGMPVAGVEAYVKASGGTFQCTPAAEAGRRDCVGTVPFPGFQRPLDLRITASHDSATVIVVSAQVLGSIAPTWVLGLRESFGTPVHVELPGVQQSWQWNRAGQTMLLVERKIPKENKLETSVSLRVAGSR